MVNRNRGVNMETFNWKFFSLALLVVFMFIAVGFAIALRSVPLIILFILLAFGLMGYGLALKKKQK